MLSNISIISISFQSATILFCFPPPLRRFRASSPLPLAGRAGQFRRLPALPESCPRKTGERYDKASPVQGVLGVSQCAHWEVVVVASVSMTNPARAPVAPTIGRRQRNQASPHSLPANPRPTSLYTSRHCAPVTDATCAAFRHSAHPPMWGPVAPRLSCPLAQKGHSPKAASF